MTRLRREAGRYVRKDTVTVEMLKIALGSHKQYCKRGNHEIRVETSSPNRAYPDMELCATCDLCLACQAAGRIQAPIFPAVERLSDGRVKYTCQASTQRIRFLYHGTCCIEYDVDAHMLTGHGTHGWSMSTNNAIRNYVNALKELGYFSSDTGSRMLQAVRRDGRGHVDSDAPWYSTKE